jgi:thiol-disulfide isomerase/thioredoxin
LVTTGRCHRRTGARRGRAGAIEARSNRAGIKQAVTATPEHATRARPRWLALLAVAAVAGAFAGLAGVYGIGGFVRNAGDPDCRSAAETARRVAPLARGEVAAMAVAESPLRMPDVGFHDRAGAERRLSDWHGRTVLLNLWATWCIPCRKEMPALDALEGTLGGERFEVVAVNIDTRDPNKPSAWLQEVGVTRLAYYADPSAKVFQDIKLAGRAFGLPTTVLVDPAGCEIGTAAGPAEWASQDGLALVRAALGG